jgi:hemoglobin
MNQPTSKPTRLIGASLELALRPLTLVFISAVLTALAGCGTGKNGQPKDDFFTSGSREADQRASQRMAKDEQLAGSGEGSGEKKVTTAKSGEDGKAAAEAQGKLTLFERLGGEPGLTAIVDDFIPRVLQDPRVNWERNAVKRSGVFTRNRSVAWKPTPENIATLKKHFVQFLSLATGGPAQYEGKDMKAIHANMQIANPEFDAALGDIKASLDKLKTPNKEQKELLAILESTRPQVVTER